MKAVTIVAAGAALVGSVTAGSNLHKKLHARSGWEEWTSSAVAESSTPAPATSATTPYIPKDTTTSDPAKATSTTSSWEEWTTTTTSSDPVKDTTKTTTTTTTTPAWEDWSSTTTTTSSDPVKDTTTSTTTTTFVWEDWTTTSSDPSEITTTSSEEHTWADWSATSSDPSEITTTSSGEHTWADWSATSSDPAVVTSTGTETWEDWSSTTDEKSGTTTTTIYLGKPSDSTSSVPADLTATTTWADWSSVPASETSSASKPVWSSDGWFGPGWGSDGECAYQVVTSYGSPIWSPTPDATSSLPVLSVTVSPTAPYEEASTTSWEDWSATSSDPAVVTSTSTTSWEDWSASSSDPAVVTSTATTSWEDWSTTSSDPAVVTSSSATSWESWAAAPTGGLGSGKGTWGLTYSPYTSEGGCKDAGTVSADLAVIAGKGFSTVRVYSTDCDTLENVGKAASDNGLKLILGVFISSTGIAGAKEQVWDIIGWAQWNLVELIVVGNEAVFNGYCSATELAAFISESADFFKKAGYTGPVTTTEPLAEWTKDGSAFCDSIDVVAANLYAFFNADVTPDTAGDFIQRQITELEAVCPGKETYVMETGWPSAGNCNGAACPSKENQATAIKSIQAVTGSKVIYFSYEDEAWKEPGEFNVEQHWGCASVF